MLLCDKIKKIKTLLSKGDFFAIDEKPITLFGTSSHIAISAKHIGKKAFVIIF